MAIILQYLMPILCLGLDLEDHMTEIRSKCWDLNSDPNFKEILYKKILLFSCGKKKIDDSTFNSLSFDLTNKSLVYKIEDSNYSIMNFIYLFPDNFEETLKTSLENSDYRKIDSLSDHSDFCLKTLESFFSLERPVHLHSRTKADWEEAKVRHGIWLTVAWIYLISVGIISARYFRSSNWWLYVHILTTFSASLIAYFYSLDIYKEGSTRYKRFKKMKFFHSRIGHFLLGVIIAQLLSGLFLIYLRTLSKNPELFVSIGKVHKIIGYTTFMVGLTNCYIGWTFIENDYELLSYFIIIIITFFIFFEYRKISKKLPETTHFEIIQKIRKNLKYSFIDERVVYLKGFSHPGGSVLIEETIGQDLGKYLNGCVSFSSSYSPYTHSEESLSIIKDLSSHVIKYPSDYFSVGPCDYSIMDFKLVARYNLTETTYLIYLSNDNYKLPPHCDSANNLLKHFLFIADSAKRYYSPVFVDPLTWLNSEKPLDRNGNFSGCLKFIFKHYPSGKLSSRLAADPIGSMFSLKGPLGPGISTETLLDPLLIITGGTGLVPFLDLIYYAVHHKKSLTIYSFFKDKKQVFLEDLLKALPLIHSFITIHVLFTPRDELVQSSIISKSLSSAHIYICGPSDFNLTFSKILSACSEKITLM